MRLTVSDCYGIMSVSITSWFAGWPSLPGFRSCYLRPYRLVSRIGTETYASNYRPSKMTGFESESVDSCIGQKEDAVVQAPASLHRRHKAHWPSDLWPTVTSRCPLQKVSIPIITISSRPSATYYDSQIRSILSTARNMLVLPIIYHR